MRPYFSVIVPTYHRPAALARCLEALARMDYARDGYEVIVVDDDGGDASPEPVIAPFAGRMDVELLRQPNAGPAAARNAGARRARGRFLAFTDDDCEPTPGWLTRIEAHLVEEPECLVGGRTENALPENACSTASQMLLDYLYAYYNDERGGARFVASNNFAAPAALFREIAGFDASFPIAGGEDRELCDRWLQHGYRIRYAPDVVMRHGHPLTLRSFVRQHFNYGRGALSYHEARRRRGRGRVRVEPARFYTGVLRFPFGRTRPLAALRLSLLLMLAQAANAAGFFVERGRPVNRKPASGRSGNSAGPVAAAAPPVRAGSGSAAVSAPGNAIPHSRIGD